MTPRILIFGAHPDDAEFHCGGMMARWQELGFVMHVISVTNGAAGHHRLSPNELGKVRRSELAQSTALLGASYEVWDFADGELTASLEARRAVIGAIRRQRPDLVITHRLNDYHPDHRAVGQLVQDASYMVRVPHVVPSEPALARDPVVAYMADFFTRPNPFRADLVFDITEQLERVADALICHASQVFEWIPHLEGREHEVPNDPTERRRWFMQWYAARPRALAKRFLENGTDRFAEALEISEYAGKLTPELRAQLTA